METRPLILIAEDEPDVARLVRYQMQRRGYGTVLAGDGLAALNLAFERHPDLILLDLLLPKLHGLEVCRMLKTSPTTQQIPILILTAMAAASDKVQGFGRGADDYLTKPFAAGELMARVELLLQRCSPAP